MASLIDHLILFGSFFITGIVIGFVLTVVLMQGSKVRY